jgi:hypothetical protein
MAESVVVTQTIKPVIVTQTSNKVIISSPGPQGPRGRTILNGSGDPSANLGLVGDFYFDITSAAFHGPKVSDSSWSGSNKIFLTNNTLAYTWELAQLTGPVLGVYSLVINHGLGYHPNVTVRSSAGDILETGIDYNSINQLTLTMAQPFSGTAYLS